jgi:hypothetical protein
LGSALLLVEYCTASILKSLGFDKKNEDTIGLKCSRLTLANATVGEVVDWQLSRMDNNSNMYSIANATNSLKMSGSVDSGCITS